jgi:hypothetical protein
VGYTASCSKKSEPDFLDEIYKHLGLKTVQEAFVVIYNQNNRFFLNEAEQGSKDARSTNIVNRTRGFLVAFENHGLNYMIGNSGKAVPDLKHWSDIAYLKWTDPIATVAPESGELKYVLRNAIGNGDTTNIINKVLHQYQQTAKKNKDWEPKWSGIDFPADSEQAQALIGTPNGHGVTWLLIQHKDKKLLGHKAVEKVILFYADKE